MNMCLQGRPRPPQDRVGTRRLAWCLTLFVYCNGMQGMMERPPAASMQLPYSPYAATI